VDYNRCGTPLVEIVTEPDLHSAEQAHAWLSLLRVTLRQLGVSDVKMEEGSLRADANVSIRPAGSSELGTKTELKNMNSFRFLEQGVRAEIERQTQLVESGSAVVQETLHYDPSSGRLTSLRSKEEAHDYRYFPEPDLVPLHVDAATLEATLARLPELPVARAERYERELGLPADRARELAFRAELGDYYERALAAGGPANGAAVALANWIPQLVQRIGSNADPAQSRVTPEALAELAAMVDRRALSRDAAREVLTLLVSEGGAARTIVEREGLGAIAGDTGELGAIVDRALAADPGAVAKLREGNMKVIGALVGFVMRETKGRADGGEVRRLILERIQGG
jgi:aspartyl-tRNA(Asn)/glutamyl-tRNA(Gln) amidotransferase subunit B